MNNHIQNTIQHPPLSMEADFKLLRLILLDSYSPGGEVIINLADGAILTGENGSGKTSLLRIIPIFYGENPGRTIVGTDSFTDFYFQRSTSYVIFEYQRRDVTCLSVLYAGDSDLYAYRFIRSAYSLSLFTAEDLKTLIKSVDLKKHLKTLGVNHTRELALSEYRAIIQGHAISGKDMVFQRQLVADYSFTSSGSRLDHIEKIVSGMFQRKANFDDFLRMVVSYISDHTTPISISGDRKKIDTWPEHFSAYQEVMQHVGRMAEIESIDAKLKANDHELCCLHSKFQVLLHHYEVLETSLFEKQTVIADKMTVEENYYRDKTSEIQVKESKAGVDAEQYERLVNQLDQEEQSYRKDNIEEKATLVEKIDELKAESKFLADRKEKLLGEQGRIDQYYENLRLEVEKSYLTQERKNISQKDAIREKYKPLFQKNLNDQQAEEQNVHKEFNDRLAELRENQAGAREQLAHWKAVVSNPPASPLAVKALEEKQAERNELQQTWQKMEEKRGLLESHKKQAMRSYDEQDNIANNYRRQINDLILVIDGLLNHANPDKNSLLHFLRESRPDWNVDIAKVIREDLLSRNDLSPSITEDSAHTLYGLSFDLTRIDSSLFADESRLQEQIADKQKSLEDLRKHLKIAEDALTERNDHRKAAETALADHVALIEKSRAKDRVLFAEIDAARRLVNESKQRSKIEAESKANEAQRQIKLLEEQINVLQTTLKTALRICSEKFGVVRQGLENQQSADLKIIEKQLKNAGENKDKQLHDLEIERKNALSSKGIDIEILQGIEKKIKEIQAQIANANDLIESVAHWRRWLETAWPHRPQYAANVSLLRQQEQEYRVARAELARALAERQKVHQEEIKSLNHQMSEANAIRRDVHAKIGRFESYPADSTTLSLPYDPSWTPAGLFLQANELLTQKKISMSDLNERVRVIKLSFRRGSGSPTEQYFDSIQATIKEDNDPRMWVEPFRQWFNDKHKEYQRILLVDAQSHFRQIQKFYSEVTSFQRDVQQFNRDIKRALDQTIVFDRISRVSIEFLSTIDRLKYWKTIQEFIENHRTWVNSISQGMPPDTFADGIKRLMEHWEVREGIRAERRNLIDVRGEAIENGKLKIFVNAKDLETLSSNGLSYLILCTIFVAFIRKIRGDANVQITWAVDELLDLDIRNIGTLLKMLQKNGIVLVSACPDADMDVLLHFKKRYKVMRNENIPEVAEPEIDMGAGTYV